MNMENTLLNVSLRAGEPSRKELMMDTKVTLLLFFLSINMDYSNSSTEQ